MLLLFPYYWPNNDIIPKLVQKVENFSYLDLTGLIKMFQIGVNCDVIALIPGCLASL